MIARQLSHLTQSPPGMRTRFSSTACFGVYSFLNQANVFSSWDELQSYHTRRSQPNGAREMLVSQSRSPYTPAYLKSRIVPRKSPTGAIMRTVRRLLTAALLLASATPSELYAQRSVVIVPPGVDIRHPRISGDGSTIAYSLAPSIAGSFPLRLVRGDGSQLFAVPSVSVGNVMALSDDGRLL